jgi:hypothetical protein
MMMKKRGAASTWRSIIDLFMIEDHPKRLLLVSERGAVINNNRKNGLFLLRMINYFSLSCLLAASFKMIVVVVAVMG